MTQLEQYLKNATRGLWGKHKLEVQEELESDILERTRKYEISGLEHHTAILQAIQEFGNARDVNRGMTRLYTMPTILKSLILATAVLLTINSITKPVSAVKPLPPFEVQCVKPSGSQYSFELYPNTNGKRPSDAIITRAFKPVVLNWEQMGTYLPTLQKRLGLTMQMSGNSFGNKIPVSQRPRQLECRSFKSGTLEALKIMKKFVAQVKFPARFPK